MEAFIKGVGFCLGGIIMVYMVAIVLIVCAPFLVLGELLGAKPVKKGRKYKKSK